MDGQRDGGMEGKTAKRILRKMDKNRKWWTDILTFICKREQTNHERVRIEEKIKVFQ